MTMRPPIPATTSPTGRPASPAREMSRRISPSGQVAVGGCDRQSFGGTMAVMSPGGSATTNRLLAKPLGSMKMRPPIAFISRRAAKSPMPEPRDRPRPSTRTNGSKTLSQSSIGTPGPSSVT